MLDVGIGLTIGIIVLAIVLVVSIILSMWKKVPQDEAGVVTGLKKRVITGGGGVVIPVFERMDKISLGNIPLSVSTKNSLSSQGVPISVVTTAVIKVRNSTDDILAAIEQFIGRNQVEIAENIEKTAISVLEGKLREIIATMTVEELYQKREEFSSKVSDVVGTELGNMGLEVKNFTITDISDDNGYIKALGEGMIAQRKKEADIQKAEAAKEVQIKTSQARQQGESAKLQAETEIAESEKNKQVQQAQYEEEKFKAQAKAELAHDIQTNITQREVIQSEADAELLRQNRQKEIAEAEIQVEIAKAQRNTELKEQLAIEREKALLSEIIKPAEADRKKQAEEAEARKFDAVKKAEAEAEKKKIDALAEAEAIKARALAEAEAIRAKAEAEADAVARTGKAEAEAISAKMKAEAEGTEAKLLAEAQGLEKKAEALTKMNEAGITQMIIDKLPEIAKAVASPMSQIDKITIIDSGNGESGVSQVNSFVPSALTKTIEAVKETTGFDLVDVMKANTLHGKTDRNITIEGDIMENMTK